MAALLEYGDIHRAFLQAVMTKGVLRGKEVFSLFPEILKEYEYEFDPADREALKDTLQSVIFKINRQVRSLGMEIRRCLDERNGAFVFVLINRISSQQTISAFKDYTAIEMEYFKLILTAMFQEETRSMSFTQCLNLTTRLPRKLSMEDGERFLERMIADNWLEKAHGEIRLHVRAIHELEPFLKAVFELQDCQLCKSIVVMKKNQQCAKCGAQAHTQCISKQRRRHCPNEKCGVAWPENNSQSSGTDSLSQRSPVKQKRVKPMPESGSDNDEERETRAQRRKK